MFGEEEVERQLRAIVAELDPALLHPNDAVTRLATFDRIERQAAAAKMTSELSVSSCQVPVQSVEMLGLPASS